MSYLKRVFYRFNKFLDPFGRFLSKDLLSFWKSFGSALSPSVFISENNNGYMIEMTLPGIDKQDLQVAVTNNLITIYCEKGIPVYNKFLHSSFVKSFSLPGRANLEKLSARYINGVLNLFAPKNGGRKKMYSSNIIVQ